MTYGGPSRQTWKASWVTAAAPRRLAKTRVTLTGPTRFGAAAYGSVSGRSSIVGCARAGRAAPAEADPARRGREGAGAVAADQPC